MANPTPAKSVTPAADPDSLRAGQIRGRVLAALGRPEHLYRVTVVPVGGDHFRVNVMTGESLSTIRIPHSYFVAADDLGNITRCTPALQRVY